MNKILPIILVVVLSGCATVEERYADKPYIPDSAKGGSIFGTLGLPESMTNPSAFRNYSGGTLNDLLKARHQCASELGGSMSCGAFLNCLALKGWVKKDNANNLKNILVPSKYKVNCTP